MLSAKLVALCVCPAVLAPPVIVAVHRPARHAVAHILHRAADKLDNSAPKPAAPPQFAEIPCPTLAGPGLGGLGGPTGLDVGGGSPAAGFSSAGFGFGGGAYGGFSSGVSGGGFAAAGGGGGGSGATPVSPPGGMAGMLPPANGSMTGSVPDPAMWALLVTGFGVVGVGLRIKRPSAAGRIAG